MTPMRPEFSRLVRLSRIGGAGLEQTVAADADECRALARRLAIPAVASLTCRFDLAPGRAGRVAATAELRSQLTRICVVTLEPFEATVIERFALCFVPEASAEGEGSADIDPEAPDEISYAGEQIDLGEAAAEQLALALDPYPRMPGVALPGGGEDGAEGGAEDGHGGGAGPFAALARRLS